ncbi:TPA: hypothetical protein I8Y21_005762 [Klebsiella oxytoca]|uniref:Uncharacterized protein n=1 Tax=Klebsiella oxytoca TaxID=571 RepID=A0AAN5LED3_KLEOX|nr:hypothetical protein [Klebsiella oxytoca]
MNAISDVTDLNTVFPTDERVEVRLVMKKEVATSLIKLAEYISYDDIRKNVATDADAAGVIMALDILAKELLRQSEPEGM